MVRNMFLTRPILNLEDHPLPAVSNCFFNIIAVTLYIEVRSCFPNIWDSCPLITGLDALKMVDIKTNMQ